MKSFVGTLVTIAVISTFTISVAMAATLHHVKISFDCPVISDKTKDTIKNDGTYLTGKGIERVNYDTPTHPIFEGHIVPDANIPVNLDAAGYIGSGVDYNPLSGAVTCYFLSNMGFAPFSISYLMTNALDGIIVSSNDEQIHIKLPTGLK